MQPHDIVPAIAEHRRQHRFGVLVELWWGTWRLPGVAQHFLQKRAAVPSGDPHFGHRCPSFEPLCSQNAESAGFSALHFPQTIQLHFTPTSVSWLNLVERWFALITGQAIRCGSFDSVGRLERTIMGWLQYWNEHAQPFHWTKSAAAIKRSLQNVTAIYETRH